MALIMKPEHSLITLQLIGLQTPANPLFVLRQVLHVYKQILLSSRQTFGEDEATLAKVVQNVRSKFKENKDEKDPAKIEEVSSRIAAVIEFINSLRSIH